MLSKKIIATFAILASSSLVSAAPPSDWENTSTLVISEGYVQPGVYRVDKTEYYYAPDPASIPTGQEAYENLQYSPYIQLQSRDVIQTYNPREPRSHEVVKFGVHKLTDDNLFTQGRSFYFQTDSTRRLAFYLRNKRLLALAQMQLQIDDATVKPGTCIYFDRTSASFSFC